MFVLAVFWAVGFATVADYGATTDEPWRMLWSRGWMNALDTGEISAWVAMPEREYYGAIYDVSGRLAWLASEKWFGGVDEFLPRHCLNLVAAGAALLGTRKLGERVAGPWVGLLAMVLLATAPRFYGSAFINPKDIPFSAAAVWAAWACIGLAQHPSSRRWVVTGALAGICAAVRPFGVVFFFLAAAAVLVGAQLSWRDKPGIARAAARAIGVVVVGYACCFVLWPVLWVRPPWHLITASMDLTQHVHGSRSLFMGELHPFWNAPSSYAIVWLGVTVPIVSLLGALAALVGLAAKARDGLGDLRRAFGYVLLCAWVVGPAVLPALRQTTLYDASRHLLFIVPPLCILAAIAWVHVARRSRTALRIVVGALGLNVVAAIIACTSLHPYQSLYFNELVGGVRGAQGRFDVAHYSETYRAGFQWIRDEHPGARVHIVGNGSAAGSYFGWKYGLGLNAEKFEYFLSEVRQGWEQTMPGEVVHRIERQGVPLLEIRRVDPMHGPRTGFVRPKVAADGDERPRPPGDGELDGWQPIEAHDGRFDIDAALHGQPGYLAVAMAAENELDVRLVLNYYLGLRAWLGDALIYQGDVVPFHYRGTENFPSLVPVRAPVQAGSTWFIADVSRTRQHWQFGLYAPVEDLSWPD